VFVIKSFCTDFPRYIKDQFNMENRRTKKKEKKAETEKMHGTKHSHQIKTDDTYLFKCQTQIIELTDIFCCNCYNACTDSVKAIFSCRMKRSFELKGLKVIKKKQSCQQY